MSSSRDIFHAGGPDVISKQYPKFNRGKIPPQVMDETGFEDCDYISIEEHWEHWRQIAVKLKPFEMEFHVPCRSPLDHLMSQCNYRHQTFDCEAEDLKAEVDACLIYMNRFGKNLTLISSSSNDVTLKCFNPIPIDPYLEYMSKFLQRRRLETSCIHRPTNDKRQKDKECIWNNKEVADRVLEILLKNVEYYSFCNECTGSDNDLLR